MSDYKATVLVLHEFDLITTEQAEQALEEWDREEREMERRRDAFLAEWKKTTPWWKKLFGPGWVVEFIRSERAL